MLPTGGWSHRVFTRKKHECVTGGDGLMPYQWGTRGAGMGAGVYLLLLLLQAILHMESATERMILVRRAAPAALCGPYFCACSAFAHACGARSRSVTGPAPSAPCRPRERATNSGAVVVFSAHRADAWRPAVARARQAPGRAVPGARRAVRRAEALDNLPCV